MNLTDSRLTFICDTQEVNERGVHLSRYGCLCGKEILCPPCLVNYEKRPLKSCGCLARDKAILLLRKSHERMCEINRVKNRTHGMSYTPFYKVWASMLARCNNQNHKAYKHYGGRGIRVGDKWLKFEGFYADMYSSYLEHRKQLGSSVRSTTLERIDNNAGYSKSNCRWATYLEQAQNTQKSHRLTHKGQTMTIEAWTRYLGFTNNLIRDRIKRGWSVERTLTTPIQKRIEHAA